MAGEIEATAKLAVMFSINLGFRAESLDDSVGDTDGVGTGAAVAADARTELATSAVLAAMTSCRRTDMDFPNCLATQPGAPHNRGRANPGAGMGLQSRPSFLVTG